MKFKLIQAIMVVIVSFKTEELLFKKNEVARVITTFLPL